MKFILSIGGKLWRCDSAVEAAKIADLLAKQTPLDHVYQAGSSPEVYHEKSGYEHKVIIQEVTDKMFFTKSDAKIKELVKAELLRRNPKEPAVDAATED